MKSYFWFRRDLRLEDNAGLYHALKTGHKIQCIFIFDTHILSKLPTNTDPRVAFIYNELKRLKSELNKLNSDLKVVFGKPLEVWSEILNAEDVDSIFCNEDYESYAIERDKLTKELAALNNCKFLAFKDQIIFNAKEILKDDQTPYVVFTPYKRKWLAKLDSKMKSGQSYYLKSYPTEKYFSNFISTNSEEMLSLNSIGFDDSGIKASPKEVSQKRIKEYDKNRDFPAINGTSKLGVHFRFGTVSIRQKARKALKLNATYLSELVWRDFYSQILQHFPHVEKNAFRKKYERVEWRNDEDEFSAWCLGQTGYPMVDAGMRELNATGHMHNRVRMVVASFLTKHLLIDWRWGEAYFADKLLDFDLASNNGGWQWAAGCGTDAAPYFRIFNPTSQMTKFDKEAKYVKKWIPEWGTDKYVDPIVDHKMARERCLTAYKLALSQDVG